MKIARLPGSVLVSAALGAALTPLNSTMVAVALPALAVEFTASAAAVTVLVVTGYLIATLVLSVPAGSVADRIGYGRALTWGRWMFAAGAVIGALSPVLGIVVVGRLLMQDKLPLSEHLLFVSGRTSFEIVQKAFLAGIPIVAAVSAPSSLAIDLARECGVTLIGFLRGRNFNIYACPARIV